MAHQKPTVKLLQRQQKTSSNFSP